MIGIADLSTDIINRSYNIFSGIFSSASAVGFGKPATIDNNTSPVPGTSTNPSPIPSQPASPLKFNDSKTFQSVRIKHSADSMQESSPPTSSTPPPIISSTPASSANMASVSSPASSSSANSSSSSAYNANSSTPQQRGSADEEMKLLNSRGRLDFVLQEGVLENPYLSSLSSHMTYWPDADVALFMLKSLYFDEK